MNKMCMKTLFILRAAVSAAARRCACKLTIDLVYLHYGMKYIFLTNMNFHIDVKFNPTVFFTLFNFSLD